MAEPLPAAEAPTTWVGCSWIICGCRVAVATAAGAVAVVAGAAEEETEAAGED